MRVTSQSVRCIMRRIKEIKDRDFRREVLNAKVPVLVDFFAHWCPPCRRQAPILDQLAEDYGKRVKIVKVNTDEQQRWATELGVRGLPTLAFFYNGRLVAKQAGLIPYDNLAKAFNVLLEPPAAAS